MLPHGCIVTPFIDSCRVFRFSDLGRTAAMSSVDETASKRPPPSARNSLDEPVEVGSSSKRSRINDQTEGEAPADSSHDASSSTTIHIGTRKSVLARVQTDLVISVLQKSWPDISTEVHAISTMGDKNQITALPDFDAKSLWTFELEDMLLKGDVDVIVHSLKGTGGAKEPYLFCTCFRVLLLFLLLCWK